MPPSLQPQMFFSHWFKINRICHNFAPPPSPFPPSLGFCFPSVVTSARDSTSVYTPTFGRLYVTQMQASTSNTRHSFSRLHNQTQSCLHTLHHPFPPPSYPPPSQLSAHRSFCMEMMESILSAWPKMSTIQRIEWHTAVARLDMCQYSTWSDVTQPSICVYPGRAHFKMKVS